MPVVTTAIPVYNGGELFRPTLDCLVAQTRRPDRVIIQDNCSTDGTRDLVKQYSDKYGFELIQNETNLGHSKNLNKCLSWADQTDYLHILLADDLVKPTFIERCLAALGDVNGRGIAYAPFEVIDENGELMGAASDFTCPHKPHPDGGFIDIPKKRYLAAQAELQTALVPAVLMKTNRLPCPMEFRTDMPHVGDCVFYGEWGALCEGIREVREILCQYAAIQEPPPTATSSTSTRGSSTNGKSCARSGNSSRKVPSHIGFASNGICACSRPGLQ